MATHVCARRPLLQLLLLQTLYWALQTATLAVLSDDTARTDATWLSDADDSHNEIQVRAEHLLDRSGPDAHASSASASYADTNSLIDQILGGTARYVLEPPNITEPPRRVQQIEGANAYFWCRVTGNPTPTVVWHKNGQSIPERRGGSRLSIQKYPTGGSVLLIERVNRNDSALYSCIVSSDASSRPLNASAMLDVVPPQRVPPNVYPRFTLVQEPLEDGRSVSYDRDARIEFACRVNCSDTFTVFWFKNNLLLELQDASSRTAKRYKDRANSLIINQASDSDGGAYNCVVLTQSGWMLVSRPVPVTVMQRITAPSFLVAPTDIEVSSGSDLNLTCVALGNPVPKVQWFTGNAVISLEPITTDRLVPSLNSEDVSRANGAPPSGRAIAMMKNLVTTSNYTCIAESKYGIINKTITVKVRERPPQPVNFTLVRYSATSATFTWNAPAASSAETRPFTFLVEWREKLNASAETKMNHSDSPITITDLRPYTAYLVRVYTVGDIAFSLPTDYTQFITRESAPRTAPRDVRARVSNASNTTIEVSWQEPDEPNGVLIGYTVLYVLADDFGSTSWRGPLPVSNWSALEVNATQKRAKLRGLQVDRTYKIAVNAKTKAGHGPLCEPIYVTTNWKVPLQPTGLQALAVSNNAIQLLWNAPPQNNVDVVAYTVYYNSTPARFERLEYRPELSHAKVVSHRLVGLMSGTAYTVRVSAKGRDGEGPLSNAVTAQTDDSKPEAAPTNLQSVPDTSRNFAVSLRFSAVQPNKTNGRITHHRVYVLRLDRELASKIDLLQKALQFPMPADFSSVPLLSVLPDSASMSEAQYKNLLQQLAAECASPREFSVDLQPVVLDSLAPFSKYLVCMTAVNSAGESVKSDWILSFTIDTVPSAPSLFNVTALNSTTFLATWLSPADSDRRGIIKKYILVYETTGSRPAQVEVDADALDQPDQPLVLYKKIVTNLTPNTVYEVLVKAVTRKGDGLAANAKVQTPPAVPGPPRSLQLADMPQADSNSLSCLVRVSWSPPAQTYGSPITGYRLHYARLESANGSVLLQSSIELNATNTELVADCGAWILVNLYARTSVGESKPAQQTYYVAERTPTGSPEMATFAALSNSSASLTWLAPAPSLRGGRILSYAIQCTSESLSLDFHNTTNQTSMTLNDLERGAQYFCQLRAATSAGYGPAVNLSFVFNGEKPEPPSNIATLRLNETRMRISWSIPPQSISWVTVHYTEAGRTILEFSRWRKVRIPVAKLWIVDGLTATEAYLVRLTATASDGFESDPSSEYLVPALSDTTIAYGTAEAVDILSTLVVEHIDAASITLKWSLSQQLSAERIQEVTAGYRVEYSCFRWYIDERGQNRSTPTDRWMKDVPANQNRVTLLGLTPACPYRIALRSIVKSNYAQLYNFATRHETVCTLLGTPPPPGVPERLSETALLKFYFPAASSLHGPISYYHVVAVPEVVTISRSPDSFTDSELQLYRTTGNTSDGVRVTEVSHLPAELVLTNLFESEQLAQNQAYRMFIRAYIDQRQASLSTECARQWSSLPAQLDVTSSTSKYSAPFTFTLSAAFDEVSGEEAQSLDMLVLIVGPVAGAFALVLCIVIVLSVVKNQRRSHSNARTRLVDALYDQPKQVDKTYAHANGNGNGNVNGSLFGNGKLIEMQDVTMRQPLLGTAVTQDANGNSTLRTVSSFSNGANGILANGNTIFNDSPFAAMCNGHSPISPCGTMRHGASRPSCGVQVFADINPLVHAAGSASSAATSDQNSGTTHINSPASGGRLPIAAEHFRAHVERLRSSENALLAQEYESIDPGSHFTWEHSNKDANKTKNRYANVVAYDHSRVVLTQLGFDSHSDYINGNFMDGYRKQNAYIATQGPLPNTIGDFWRMCWEQRSVVIVMMTKLEERSRVKCDQYWPNRGTETYGDVVHVTLNDTQEFAYYVMRSLTIQLVGQSEKREVKQLQFTAWPDHGVPEHPSPLLMFIRRVRSCYVPDMGPVVVHCSAGVGRTGAFIVIDSQLDRVRQEGTVDVYGHVTLLRGQRNYIVQTEDQYIFIHDAILDALECNMAGGSPTEVPARGLFAYLQKLRVPNIIADNVRVSINGSLNSAASSGNATLINGLEAQFRKLQAMRLRPDAAQCAAATLPINRFKNRIVNILPYENTRVQLTPLRCIDGSDYINASYIDGYRQRRMYIATQGCMPETADDFWRMIWDRQSTIIVMLTKLRESGREKCAQYWPAERSARFQHLVVDPTAEYEMPSYTLREFKVTDARDGLTRTVRQFAFTEWPEQGVPKGGETFVQFIGQVHKTKEQFGQDGPITVHCDSGSGRTGVFIALSILLERLRYEGLVDVLQTVRMLRLQRPAMVQTVEQYQFIYSTVIEYLGSFDHYAT